MKTETDRATNLGLARENRRAHPRKPDRALLVMHVHQEEDDPRLQVPSNVVDDESLSNVVNLDKRSSRRLHRLVSLGVFGDPSHVVFDGLVRVPSVVLGQRAEKKMTSGSACDRGDPEESGNVSMPHVRRAQLDGTNVGFDDLISVANVLCRTRRHTRSTIQHKRGFTRMFDDRERTHQ